MFGRHGRPFHPRTDSRLMKRHEIRSRRPNKGLQRYRLQCAGLKPIQRQNWTQVVFSDESNVSNAGGRCRVYCRLYARYVDTCVLEHDGFGGGGVMVWGVITDNFNSC